MTGSDVQFNRRATLLASMLILPFASTLEARCPDSRTPRIALLSGVFVAGQVTALAARHQDWWEPPARGFHVVWGGSSSKGQDGLAHGAIAYQTAQLGRLAWRWACVGEPAAAWLGAVTGIAISLPKEIGDGFHQNGFSGTDMAFTAAGAILPALHRSAPDTRVVSLKVQYWPSDELRTSTGPLPQLENDWAGQRYFLSINPARVRGTTGWPPWLGVAAGHGVPSWVIAPPRHQWFVTLDLEFRGLPVRAPWWRSVATILDQWHFPAPGVRFADGRASVGLF